MWLIILILALNFGISWWNCYACGRSWVEAKTLGGWPYLIVWCGAIQAALGFSSVFIFPLAFVTHALVPTYMNDQMLKAMISLWYLTVIFPILGTGFILMIESWRAAYRERSLSSMGVAGWNTFAQVHNTMSAFNGIGDAAGEVGKAFSSAIDGDSDDAKSKIGLLLVFLIVFISVGLGVFLTYGLIHKYAATEPLPKAAHTHLRSIRE